MNILRIKNLKVDIEGASRIQGVNLEIKSGELTCILGANGSGKSSLLRGIISSEGCALSGEIELNNVDITYNTIDEKARKGIFYSPQHTPNIEGVKLISLIYGAYIKLTIDIEPLNIIDVRKKVIDLCISYGLKTDLIDRPIGVGLSGGEKKQSELLQLLILKPSFCLLDEPDSGVDIDTIKIFVRIIKDLLSSGTGVLLVSHNIEMLESLNVKNIHIAKEGKIIKSGDSELILEIKKNGF